MEILHSIFQFETAIKIAHWQTTSYAAHITLDKILEEASKKFDEFIEVYQGTFGRIYESHKMAILQKGRRSSSRPPPPLTISIENVPKKKYIALVKKSSQFWKSLSLQTHPELATIRDEIVAVLHQALYLLSLH